MESKVNVSAIGLFRCRSDAESDTIQVITESNLSQYENPVRVTEKLIGKLTGKDFIGQKNARVHEFTERANKPRDADANSTKKVLSNLAKGEKPTEIEVQENFETLAQWYHQTDYAQSGLLIICRFFNEGQPQVAILKAPFMDDTYVPDDEEVLSKMDSVVKGDLKKGILYPRIAPDNTRHEDQASIYQVKGSNKYAEHWYKYLHLEPSQTAEEILDDKLSEEGEDSPISEVDTTEEFDTVSKSLEEKVGEAVVTVSMDNKEVDIRLNELLSREQVRLVKSDVGYHVVISGSKPTVKFYSNNERKYKQILSGIEEYDSIEDVIS